MRKYYKAANMQGYDFYSGKTINYAESIGKLVKVPNYKAPPELCSSSVLHASPTPLGVFVGAKIPCRIFRVEGKPVVKDSEKCGFKQFMVLEEIPQEQLGELFGFNYVEAVNPVHPFKLEVEKPVGDEQISLLQNWDSVWASVRAQNGMMFSEIKKWEYTDNIKVKGYPYKSAVKLWRMGLVPIRYQDKWHLYGSPKGNGKVECLWTENNKDIK